MWIQQARRYKIKNGFILQARCKTWNDFKAKNGSILHTRRCKTKKGPPRVKKVQNQEWLYPTGKKVMICLGLTKHQPMRVICIRQESTKPGMTLSCRKMVQNQELLSPAGKKVQNQDWLCPAGNKAQKGAKPGMALSSWQELTKRMVLSSRQEGAKPGMALSSRQEGAK